jgi:hypothetical protein
MRRPDHCPAEAVDPKPRTAANALQARRDHLHGCRVKAARTLSLLGGTLGVSWIVAG